MSAELTNLSIQDLQQRMAEVCSPNILLERSGFSVTYDQPCNRLFIFGGYCYNEHTNQKEFLNDLLEFNLDSNSLTRV